MKIEKSLSSTLLLIFLVLSCQNMGENDEEKLRKELSTLLGMPVGLTKLTWDNCYRLELDIVKDRREFIRDPKGTFRYMHHLAQISFKPYQICQVFFQISDKRGLWFVGSVPRASFEGAKGIAYAFHEISFSEDTRKYGCKFYKENVREKAFLVCTRHTELKKLFSND